VRIRNAVYNAFYPVPPYQWVTKKKKKKKRTFSMAQINLVIACTAGSVLCRPCRDHAQRAAALPAGLAAAVEG